LLSVIIPAANEEGYIAACLAAVFASHPVAGGAEVVVVANGCRDATADRARAMARAAQVAGWGFQVLDLPQGGKPAALNAGDRAAVGDCRIYLDADVTVSPNVMAELASALAVPVARYAGATPRIPPAHSALTRVYARFWQRLPFVQSVAPGFGLFAVNAAGRARWSDFPALISDDTFVRLQFAQDERVQVPSLYDWPMIEGFAALVRVRRRQDAGVAEIARLYPYLLANEGKARLTKVGLARLAVQDPLGFAAYAAVSLAVRFGKSGGWVRGR